MPIACCYARCSANSGVTIEIVGTLQQYKNGAWSTLATWSTSGSFVVTLDKQRAVYSGYKYRFHLRPLTADTMVVLVFDTDAGSVDILKKNVKKLAACRSVSEVVLIPQVPNLEGELVRSCNIKDIRELLNSQSRTKFKRDIIHVSIWQISYRSIAFLFLCFGQACRHTRIMK